MYWDKKFDIGVDRIDFQHRIFLDLVVIFGELTEADKIDKPKASRHLIEIIKYADFHFTSEENIMIENGYPEFESHRKLHKSILKKLEDSIMKFENDSSIAPDLYKFLFEWFATHTAIEDKKIGSFLENRS